MIATKESGFVFLSPPFLQCHGSTLARLPDGRIMAAWFAGTREMNPDTAIWTAVLEGDTWQEPKLTFKIDYQAHWNPVLYVGGDGRSSIYFKVGRFPDSWDTYKSTMSNGKWTKPRLLKSKMLDCGKMTMGPVRNKIVRMSDGTLIAPSSIEQTVSRATYPYEVEWSSVFHVSKNDGKTWWTTDIVGYDRAKHGRLGGIIQPAVWESAPGVASALFRSTVGCLFRSDSLDGGKTWSEARSTDIPNPNSAIDVAVKDGVLAMVCNPISGNWARRSQLAIAFSAIDGMNFSGQIDVENGIGSYSYPSMIETPTGFAMTYTWSRRRIAFVEVNLESVAKDNGMTVKASVVRRTEAYVWGKNEVQNVG